MYKSFITIAVVIVIIGLSYYIWFRLKMLRFTRTSGPSPHITIENILESWENDTLEIPKEFEEVFKLVPEKIDDEGIKIIKEELLEIEKHSKKARIPLWEIRKALMDAVGEYYCINTFLALDDDGREKCYEGGVFVDLREIGTSTASLLALKELFKIMILRLYSLLKYNDAVSEGQEDWFTFYTKATENRWESTTKFVTAKDDGPGSFKWMYALFAKSYSENVEKLREKCLVTPPRTPLAEEIDEGKSLDPNQTEDTN